FERLRRYPFVLGQEGYSGICNAVILSAPNAEFGRRWLEGFDPARSLWRGFRSKGFDRYWNEYSVRYPAFLASCFPNDVRVEGPFSFFFPLWAPQQLQCFFRGDRRTRRDTSRHPAWEFPTELLKRAYCHHLWQSFSWEPYLKNLSLAKLKRC